MQINSHATQTPKEYKKDNYLQNAAGLATSLILFEDVLTNPATVAMQDKFIKTANSAPEIGNYIDKAFKESGLDKTNLKVKAAQVYNNSPTYFQKLNSLLDPVYGARLGRNAVYLPVFNMMFVPYKQLEASFFHEMGHAMNRNFNPLLKVMQYLGPIFKTLPVFLGIIGICTSIKKPAEGQELSKTDKFKNFIHNHAWKLALASSLPILLEEEIATIKGNKLAKRILPEELYKVVKKTNRQAGLTYLVSSLGTAAGIAAGIKLKDYLVKKKHEKAEQKSAK